MAACSRHCSPAKLAYYMNSAILLLACACSALAKEYTVGDSSGWDLGVDYATWASQYTFKPGDSLKFSYPGGVHSLQQVSDADYKACNGANAIFSGTSGSSVVKLDKAGTYNFICGVAVHCQGGMKLSVTVSDKATSSTSASAPTPVSAAPTPVGAPTKHASPSSSTTTTNPANVSPATSSTSSPSTASSSSTTSKSSPLPHPTPSILILLFLLIICPTFVMASHT